MARIIESILSKRRIIQLTADDVLSIISEYQKIVPRFSNSQMTRFLLNDKKIYLPEDV